MSPWLVGVGVLAVVVVALLVLQRIAGARRGVGGVRCESPAGWRADVEAGRVPAGSYPREELDAAWRELAEVCAETGSTVGCMRTVGGLSPEAIRLVARTVKRTHDRRASGQHQEQALRYMPGSLNQAK